MDDISASRRMRYRERCNSQTAGHVRVCDEDHETFWVTPFQCFDDTLPRRLRKPDSELFEWTATQ